MLMGRINSSAVAKTKHKRNSCCCSHNFLGIDANLATARGKQDRIHGNESLGSFLAIPAGKFQLGIQSLDAHNQLICHSNRKHGTDPTCDPSHKWHDGSRVIPPCVKIPCIRPEG